MAKPANYKAKGFRPTRNPEQHKWKMLLARSNAAQPHQTHTHKGTRAARQRREIKQQED